MSLKAKIEAVLFLTDRPIRAQAIARIVNDDVQIVRQTLLELIHDYETRGGGLEIAQDNGYIIQVKDEYSQIIDEFLPVEMSAALVRTLSAIAIKQPVAQSEIVKIRGAGAYDHIRELLVRELIAKREEGGRSPTLMTTKKFQEYFRLTRDAKSLRQDLRKQEKTGQLQLEAPGATSPQEGAQTPAVESDEAVLDKLLDSVLDTLEAGPAPDAQEEDDESSSRGTTDAPAGADQEDSAGGRSVSAPAGDGDRLVLGSDGRRPDSISEAMT